MSCIFFIVLKKMSLGKSRILFLKEEANIDSEAASYCEESKRSYWWDPQTQIKSQRNKERSIEYLSTLTLPPTVHVHILCVWNLMKYQIFTPITLFLKLFYWYHTKEARLFPFLQVTSAICAPSNTQSTTVSLTDSWQKWKCDQIYNAGLKTHCRNLNQYSQLWLCRNPGLYNSHKKDEQKINRGSQISSPYHLGSSLKNQKPGERAATTWRKHHTE